MSHLISSDDWSINKHLTCFKLVKNNLLQFINQQVLELLNISYEGEMGFFTDNNCCKKCILILTVILTVSSAVVYIFSDNFVKENVRNLDSIAYSEESTRHRVNNVQTRRLSLVTSVCNKYRNDTTHKYLYVDKPGSKIRGKFTFEPKSKLVLCNIMKQGHLCFLIRYLIVEN